MFTSAQKAATLCIRIKYAARLATRVAAKRHQRSTPAPNCEHTNHMNTRMEAYRDDHNGHSRWSFSRGSRRFGNTTYTTGQCHHDRRPTSMARRGCNARFEGSRSTFEEDEVIRMLKTLKSASRRSAYETSRLRRLGGVSIRPCHLYASDRRSPS